jgi:hypothetical protein
MSSASCGTESGGQSEEEYLPPCRLAARYITKCPQYGKPTTIKTLRYSHVCGRSWDRTSRALEQRKAAQAAVDTRLQKQTTKQTMDQKRTIERPIHTQWRTSASNGPICFVDAGAHAKFPRNPPLRSRCVIPRGQQATRRQQLAAKSRQTRSRSK